MNSIDHALHNEIQAAEVLRQTLVDIADGDEDLIRDTIEGETSLHDLIPMVAETLVLDKGLIGGIETTIKQLKDRKERIERRMAMRRTALLTAMQIAEKKTFETPAGTITRKAVPPSLLILDEAQVPSEFWKAQDPVLDKKALQEALKAGNAVAGAMMGNGSETIQLRT